MTNSSNTPKSTTKTKRKGIFGWIDHGFRLGNIFQSGIPIKYIPHILFITLLGLIYIGNSQYSRSLDRKYESLNDELDGLKAQYNTLNEVYMRDVKQTSISQRVSDDGIKSSNVPPTKILIRKNEY